MYIDQASTTESPTEQMLAESFPILHERIRPIYAIHVSSIPEKIDENGTEYIESMDRKVLVPWSNDNACLVPVLH